MKKKILVTGATGFIGKNLVESLKEKFEIYALILDEKEKNVIPQIDYILWKTFFDRENEVKTLDGKKLGKIDTVIHLASYGVNPKDNDIDKMIESNINLTKDLILNLERVSCKNIIFTGSGFEYGDKGKIKLKEDIELNPFSLYGATKVSAFLIGKKLCESLGINYINLKLFNIFGEYEGSNRLIPQIINNYLEGKELNFTAGNQVRDYLYIKDIIEVYEMILEKNIYNNETYNVCSSEEVTIKEFITKVADTIGINRDSLNFGTIPSRKEEALYIVGDNSKLKRDFDWNRKYSYEFGIKNIYDFFRKENK